MRSPNCNVMLVEMGNQTTTRCCYDDKDDHDDRWKYGMKGTISMHHWLWIDEKKRYRSSKGVKWELSLEKVEAKAQPPKKPEPGSL